jgi:predicted small lipoprotein YifL
MKDKRNGGTMFLKKLIPIIVLSLSIFAFTACESKGPVEKAGEKIDQTMEKASDKAKEATEAVKDKAEEIGQEVKKTTQ